MNLNSPIIKICCIQDRAEAQLAISLGANALGLVSDMPSGPGVISLDQIRDIAVFIPKPVESVLLTSEQSSEGILEQVEYCKPTAIQIVDKLLIGSHQDIRGEFPELIIIQVIHVTGIESIVEAEKVSSSVDALLLDSGNKLLATKVLGGTGKVHDWSISKQICKYAQIPVILAGGLDQTNVGEAIRTVNPAGLDVCSGVRTNAKLDKVKLTSYMNNIQWPD
ncbi:MAG: phosphoribosylanthranilate isomerase [Candidatus Neomarinimicrobiota bacterium]